MDIPAPYEPPPVDCLYPEIEVQLIGRDGNAFAIVGSVAKALRRGNVHPEDITIFMEDAMSKDYNYLLQTCQQWVTCL